MVAWRSSGLSAATFAGRRGYSSQSLLRWSKAVAESDPGAPQFVRLEVAPARVAPALVVEIGRARVVVPCGFDPGHLVAVLDALSGAK